MGERENLEKYLSALLEMKRNSQKKKPIFIEICGSPKSGKSSFLTSFSTFLKRNGFTTKIIGEFASECPISNKRNFTFNIWTTCSTLIQLLGIAHNEVDRERYDVVFFDRGLFDGLCWFEWLKNEEYISAENYSKYVNFFNSSVWRKMIDIVCVFTAKPEISMKREFANLLTSKSGSIMNASILEAYLRAIKGTIKKYNDKFNKIIEIETSSKNQDEVSYDLSKEIIDALHFILEEKILYFDKKVSKKFNIEQNVRKLLFDLQENYGFDFRPREKIEADNTKIQPIAIAIITNPQKNKVFVVKKADKSIREGSTAEKGKELIYIGGHIRQDDKVNTSLFETIVKGLEREISEELGQDIDISSSIEPFIVYEEKQDNNNHFAVCFPITYNQLEFNNFTLDKTEFVQKKGTSKSGRVLELSKYIQDSNYDTWSKQILIKYFGVDISNFKQTKLDI